MMKNELEGLSREIEIEQLGLEIAGKMEEFQESISKVINRPRSRSKKNKLYIAEEYAQLKF